MPTRRECANAIRALSIDAIEKARSGHPGAPLGMADMAEALWRHFLKHNPANPEWPDRDRVILSNGHASMLLYAALHLSGYNLSLDDIKNFRQFGSKTPGHPERDLSTGVEMTTGPLGQGIASAVGIALAEAMLAAYFNRPSYKIVNHYTYVFCGDGCLMEGVSHEACSLAGTWGLGKLIVLYDYNGVSIDGKTGPWFSEDVAQRYAAYHWQVIGPIDGHDSDALDLALKSARTCKDKPSLIICKTHIGFCSPKRDDSASHGAPLGKEAADITKSALHWREVPFHAPRDICRAWNAREKGQAREEEWNTLFSAYARQYPELAIEFKRRMAGRLPEGWNHVVAEILEKALAQKKDEATRQSSKDCLETLVARIPELVGGSADLSSSVGTKTTISIPLNTENYSGNYIYYGVREFAMGTIMNGFAIHGGFIPYGGTFLSFSDQAKNAIRLSALMKLHIVWIMTHDSIAVGEDGPTHQPIEQIPMLRLLPNTLVWRPCDSVEMAMSWIGAMENTIPSCIICSRQKLPQLEHPQDSLKDIAKGGYILRDTQGKPDIILIASGSETHLAIEAAEKIEAKGSKCRVVSMPCTEIFDAQDAAWRDHVLPPDVHCRLAIEAASADWWRRYTGLRGDVIGMNSFGLSAPGDELFKYFGFTVDNIIAKAEALLERNHA